MTPPAHRRDPSSASIPLWQNVAHRFPSGKDCIASFLAFEAAEVLAGVKPANLVNIVSRRGPCGRNMYSLWKRHGAALLTGTGLEADILTDRGDSLLVMLYSPDALAALLESPRARRFLLRAGYPDYRGWREAVGELGRRIRREGFPHEIGLFLGYPLKDVAAFLGWAPLPFTCQGPWKIYGDPRPSLELAHRHRECRGRMVRRLASVNDPRVCLAPRGKVAGGESCASR